MRTNLESITKWAVEAADRLPAKYQQVAFPVLLQHGLASIPAAARERDRPAELDLGRSPDTPPQPGLFSAIPKASAIARKASRMQQAVWAVIALCDRDQEADNQSIRRLVQTELGITPESRGNLAHTLRDATPTYLSRTDKTEGQGYAYNPTPQALEVFKGLDK